MNQNTFLGIVYWPHLQLLSEMLPNFALLSVVFPITILLISSVVFVAFPRKKE